MPPIKPRKSDGSVNPKYKSLINKELLILKDEQTKADKEFKKIQKLKDKAVRASLDVKGTAEEKKKKRKNIKALRDKEIERRTNAKSKADDRTFRYKENIAISTKKLNVGLLLTKSNKAYMFDLLAKEGRRNYSRQINIIEEGNYTKAQVRKISTNFEKAEKVMRARKASGRIKQLKPKKVRRELYHNGIKTDYIFDFDNLQDKHNLVVQTIANIRKALNNTLWRHPNSRFMVKVSAVDDPFKHDTDLSARSFSLSSYDTYTIAEVIDILIDKLERALEEYEDDWEDMESFDFQSIGVSFITKPEKVMGSGGHKTIQQANGLWFINGTCSRSNCFYRAISFCRIMKDLNNNIELAEELLGQDDRKLLDKINERAKHMKKKINDTTGVSRKTTTEDDIQKWVDNVYQGGKRGSNWKCEVHIYNSVFCKSRIIRPTNYIGGILTRYEVWCINHHFIPLIRWYDVANIKTLCEMKNTIDREKEEKAREANTIIKKHIATEIVDEEHFIDWLLCEKQIDHHKLKGYDKTKWERIYKYWYKNDETKVRKQINPMNNKIATYDLEATPNGNDNCFKAYRVSYSWNVLDELDAFIRVKTKSFEGEECIKKWLVWMWKNRSMFSGYTLYAHNAGKFDLLMVLSEYILENDDLWSIDTESLIVLNGAYLNLIIYHDEGGEGGVSTLQLKDSFRLLPAGLDKLTNEFNVPHKKLTGAVDFDEVNIDNCYGGKVDAPPSKVMSSQRFRLELSNYVYCNWDTIGLLEVLNIFKTEVYENMNCINITECLTGASLAKKNFFLNYYDGQNMPIYSMNEKYDTFCRKGYSGGRNEALFIGELIKKLYYNDYTSLYPDIGRKRLPYGKPRRWTKKEIATYNSKIKKGVVKRPILGMVKVIAKTINFDVLPIHGIKKDGKLLFPYLVNPTELTLWFNEMLYAQQYKAYEYEIIDVIEFGSATYGIKKSERETFWENGILSDFFNDAFEKKGKAKAEGKLALAQCYKIVANSGYGFWGLNARGKNNEGRDGMEILKCDDDSFWDMMEKGHISNMNRVGKYTMVRTSKPLPIKDYNVAVAAAICSEARIKLHRFIMAIRKVGGNVVYLDTDSCISDVDISKYPELMKEFCWDGNGDDLGSMKNEAVEKLEKYFKSKVMKDNPLLDERLDKSKIKDMIRNHMKTQKEVDGGDYYFDKGVIAGCKQYCLKKTTYDGGFIEASAAKGVRKKLNYEDFHHLIFGSKIDEQREFEKKIKEEKPDWEAPEGFRIYERQYQFRSGLISHIEGDLDIIKTPVDKSMRIHYLKGKCEGGDKIDGVEAFGYVSPLKI